MEDMWPTEDDEIEAMYAQALGLSEGELRRIGMMDTFREDILLHSDVESAETEGGQAVSQPELELEEADDVESETGCSEIEVPITGTEEDSGLYEEYIFPVSECPFVAGLAEELERAFDVPDQHPLPAGETDYLIESETECEFVAETAREIERTSGGSDQTASPAAEVESAVTGYGSTEKQYQWGYEGIDDDVDKTADTEEESGELLDITGEDLFSTSEAKQGPVLFGLSGENLLLHKQDESVEAEHDEALPVETVEEVTKLLVVSGEDMLLLAEGSPVSAESGEIAPQDAALGDVDEEDEPEVHVEELDVLTQANLAVLAYAFDQMGKMTRFCG